MNRIETALARVQEAGGALAEARRAAEDAQRRRDKAVRRAHDAGASYAYIADVLGVDRSYVYQVCRDG
jgi:hypothetical protein